MDVAQNPATFSELFFKSLTTTCLVRKFLLKLGGINKLKKH